jgi:prolipoprotein diacylglyceryltransferase
MPPQNHDTFLFFFAVTRKFTEFFRRPAKKTIKLNLAFVGTVNGKL